MSINSRQQTHQQSSSAEGSEDIFYLVKKQILDKLDIILQKMNLQIIQHVKPNEKTFKFVELSTFQKQIQILFQYLDRLYTSLNSSISYSSIDANNQYTTNFLKEQNSKLVEENEKLKTVLKNQSLDNQRGLTGKTSNSSLPGNQNSRQITSMETQSIQAWKNNLCKQCLALYERTSPFNSKINNQKSSMFYNFSKESVELKKQQSVKKDDEQSLQKMDRNSNQKNVNGSLTANSNGISLATVQKILKFYNHNIKMLAEEFKHFQRWIRRILKEEKFRIVQNRVECISGMKRLQEHLLSSNFKVQSQQFHDEVCEHCQMPVIGASSFHNTQIGNIHHTSNVHQERVLDELNSILELC